MEDLIGIGRLFSFGLLGRAASVVQNGVEEATVEGRGGETMNDTAAVKGMSAWVRADRKRHESVEY